MRPGKRSIRWLAVLLAFGLLAAACGDGDDDAAPADDTTAPADDAPAPSDDDAAPSDDAAPADDGMDMGHLGDGSLGVVTVEGRRRHPDPLP